MVTEVWGTTWIGDERIIDVHIGNLHRKHGTNTRGRGGQVRISIHRQGASTALIHVADDGEGIPPGQLGHIFERFYRGGVPPAVGTTAGPVSV